LDIGTGYYLCQISGWLDIWFYPKAGYQISGQIFGLTIIFLVKLSGQPDIRLIQKPDTRYPVRAGYQISGRISGRILGLTIIFLVKYQINL
jgi:hypothetical protein